MKVAVLFSGGVDSSFVIHLLKEQGHDVTAFYLKIWLEEDWGNMELCPWQEDVKYVQKTCELLGVPWHILPFQQVYQRRILEYVLTEVKNGYTPNPDLLCNTRIKFGTFFEELKRLAFSYEKVATGHYARVKRVGRYYELLCSIDTIKDQTYFLSHLYQEQLKYSLFPLGEYTKQEIRSQAKKIGLPSANRKDSQGLCFLGKIQFSDFLRRYIGEKSGNIIEYESKKKIGEHSGFWFYTIGQRQGLGLSGGPWYVVSKNKEKNHVYVSRDYYAPEKMRNQFFVEKLHWISGIPPQQLSTKTIRVKIRHGSPSYHCQVNIQKENKTNPKAIVQIEGNDQGIAPGQFAVFYDQKACIGCGVISESITNNA